jgi:hypothetical protein
MPGCGYNDPLNMDCGDKNWIVYVWLWENMSQYGILLSGNLTSLWMRRDIIIWNWNVLSMCKGITYGFSTSSGWVQHQQLVQELGPRGALQKAFPSDTQQVGLLCQCVSKRSSKHICKATETTQCDECLVHRIFNRVRKMDIPWGRFCF